MHTDHELRGKIMRRIWAVYVLRKVTSPVLRLGLLGGALLILGQVISVKDVFENAIHTSGLSGFARFLYSAFATTEGSVLALTLLAMALAVWFIADQVRNVAGSYNTQSI